MVDVSDDAAVATGFLDISTDAIATILVNLGTRPRLHASVHGRRVQGLAPRAHVLAEESLWQALWKNAWAISEVDLSSDWPRLTSFRSLYAVLEAWAPRQA